ncbi:MAG: ATP-binding protein [Clostridia bacterium]|nr:ATP-binding protein [Clostridia bacterium]
MGFNSDDFVRIREEYSKKYLKAHESADARRFELYAKIPELKTLDGILSGTASRIMNAVCTDNAEENIAKVRRENETLLAQRAEILSAYGYPADYTDVRYECDKCGDTGYVDTKMCSCMRRALVMAGYRSSGIYGLMKSQSFDNFSLDYYKDSRDNLVSMTRIYDGLKKYASEFDENTYKNFLFIGNTGLGKTHLSTSVAVKVIERGFDVLYVSACGMISDFESKRFGGASQQPSNDISRYYGADLLIIDDFGTELTNQFTVSCIYEVINSRMINTKSTIINTNLEKSEINARYGDRITSRLFGEYLPIIFRGKDIRQQKIK